MTRLELGAEGYSVFASVPAKARQPSVFSVPPPDAVAGDLLVVQQGDTAAIYVFIAPDAIAPDRPPTWAPLHAHVGVAPQVPGAVTPWNTGKAYNYPDMVLVGDATVGFAIWIATQAVATGGATPGTIAGDGWVAIGSGGTAGPAGPSGTLEVDPVLLGMPQDEKDRSFIRTNCESVMPVAVDARTGSVTTDASGDFTVQFSRGFQSQPTVIVQVLSNTLVVRLTSRANGTFTARAFTVATNAALVSTAITVSYIAVGPLDITQSAVERAFVSGGAAPPALLAAPDNLHVTSATNDFTGVTLAFNTVATATDYDVQVLNEAGTVLNTYATTGALSYRVTSVSADTRYQFRVRTRNATETSAWSASIKYAIGHAAVTGTRPVDKTRPWTSTVSVNAWRDQPVGVYVPVGVATSQMVLALTCTFATSLASGTATRSIGYIINNNDVGAVGSKPNPWNETIARPYYMGEVGKMCGIVPRGTGWSSTSGGGIRITGTIRLDGTEYYTESETYTITAQVLCAAW